MNFDIFKEEDKSGKMSKKSYLLKNHPKELEHILKWSNKNNLNELPLKEIIYLFINGINNSPICLNPNCNKLTKFKNRTLGYNNYCSNKCIGSDPNIIKQKEEKSLKKWGTKTPAESKVIKDKLLKTNNEKYGHNSPMSNKKIQEKFKKTLLKNWGVENPNHSEELIKKRVKSFKANIDSYKESYKKTSLERYGTEHPWQNKEIHKKCILKSSVTKNENLYKSVMDKIYSSNDMDFVDINYDSRIITLYCENCQDNFKIHREYLHIRTKENNLICTNCNPMNDGMSGMEKSVKLYIKNIYEGEIIENDRKVLDGKELDIYLPQENLAIEFNGLYWHSELNKYKKYHYDKTKKCLQKNVNLIHIWEDDWILKNDIIKSILINKIKKTPKTIYGRKCIIKEVNIKDSKEFLDKNHIQGSCNSDKKIGLYYNNTLVSIMCFSVPRGYKKEDKVFELIRFCNKLQTNIIGGASKLFKYFLNNFMVKEVISFSDNCIFDGTLYKKLGFELQNNIPISYTWVIGHVRNHKSRFKKSNLITKGYDENKSEKEIMYEDVGAFRVWDSGKKKWIYKNS